MTAVPELEPFVSVDLTRVPVARTAVGAAESDSPPAESGATALATLWGAEVGVWEMATGRMHDVEVDEAFVVLSGRATVTLLDEDDNEKHNDGENDGEERTISLAPGVLCRLSAGMRTRWEVTSTLRKIYLLPPVPPTSAPTNGDAER